METLIPIILVLIAGILNAVMDTLSFHYNKSFFSLANHKEWVDPSLSWKNKWKNGDPAQGERFWGSSTIFIFITDLWHLSKFLMILCMVGAIVLYKPFMPWWAEILILYCIFTFAFELFFRKIFIIN